MTATHTFPMPRDMTPPKEPMTPRHCFPMSSYTYRVVPPKGANIGLLARWLAHLDEYLQKCAFSTAVPSAVAKIYGREVSAEEWGGSTARWQVTLQLDASPTYLKNGLPTYLQQSAAHPEEWEATKGQRALRVEFPEFDWQWGETMLLGVRGALPLELERAGGRWKASVHASHIGEGVRFSTSRHDKAPDAVRELLLLSGQLQQFAAQLSFLKDLT